MKHLLFLFLLLRAFVLPLYSQETTLLRKGEEKVTLLFREMHRVREEQSLRLLNDSVTAIFQEILKDPASFLYPFDSLRYTGRLYSPDSSFRIINWNLSFPDGSYRYYGFILLRDTLSHSVRVVTLEDHASKIRHPEDTILPPSHWYGALYYDILLNTWQDTRYYTLLGIDYHDMFTSRKIIDVITFDKEGNVFFGAPVFRTNNKTRYRIIFEFSARVSMLLHYDKHLRMIVFDHLSPSDPRYAGIYQFYGPDSSYDGFAFYNGMWHLKKDIDVRNVQ